MRFKQAVCVSGVLGALAFALFSVAQAADRPLDPSRLRGEVFVTDDGAETDLDLGHCGRFTSSKLGKLNNLLELKRLADHHLDPGTFSCRGGAGCPP